MMSDCANPLIKVYGHHRSGCNLLCALMYKNFYEGVKQVGTQNFKRGDRRFILFGKEITTDTFDHPYARIFGGHDPKAVTHDSLYILRGWEDVEKSMKRIKYQIPKMWAGDLFTHVNHVYQALRNRPFVVYYEDLLDDAARVLQSIQMRFSLNKLRRLYVTDIPYCGWPE